MGADQVKHLQLMTRRHVISVIKGPTSCANMLAHRLGGNFGLAVGHEHTRPGPCLPDPELVDLRAAVGVEREVAGSAGEQLGGGGVGEWHPCGLVGCELV